MHKLQALIFDMDGTLADTEEFHRQAFNEAFAEFGYMWHWSRERYRELLSISGGKERIRNYLIEKGSMDDPETLWHKAETIHKRKSDIYRQKLVEGHIGLRPGVERLIREAAGAKLLLGIVTSSSRQNVDTLLRNTLGETAARLFTTIVTCDIVEDKKPSPAAYLFALAQLGLPAENCIAIEDTRNGNLAARAAGLKTIITIHDLTVDDDFTGASLVLEHLGEPDQPITVLAGEAFGYSYVDVNLLREITLSNGAVRQELRLKPAAVAAAR